MRKNQILMWAALTVTGVLASCSNEEMQNITEQDSVKTVTIRASIADDASSRIALGDSENGQTKVSWSSGDAFALTVNGTPYTFTLKEGTTDEFTYTGEFPNITSETAVTATYPADASNIDYAYQTGTTSGLSTYMTLAASASISSIKDISLTFEHNTSVMKLELTNDAFKSASVNNITVDLGGTATITTTETFTGDSDNGKVTAYVVLNTPASVNTKDVTLFVECGDKTYSASLTNEKTLEVGKLYTVAKTVEETEMEYLTFSAESEQIFYLTKAVATLQYSVGGDTWQTLGTTQVTFGGSGKNLRLRGLSSMGTAPNNADDKLSRIRFQKESVSVDCTGDIRALVDYTDHKNADTSNARFCKLFSYCEALKSVSFTLLPATDLAKHCYNNMFRSCTSLTEAPELPATVLAENCYVGMFSYCSSLAEAPELPATVLVDYCYYDMFSYCTSLVEAPVLPAETLVSGCYYGMFENCTLLTAATMLATEGFDATNCLKDWLNGIETIGTLTVKNSTVNKWFSEDGDGASCLPSNWTVEMVDAQFVSTDTSISSLADETLN